MSATPLLATVLIPVRDDAADLPRCLEAVFGQDVGLDHLEVVVVDGASRDGSSDVARALLEGSGVGAWRVVENSRATTPSNLNVGLAVVQSPVLCRVDARSIIPPQYVRRCVEVLDARADVRVVGGSQRAVARDRTARAVGIARALNNRFTMGMARYRRGAASGPTDTVYLGAFRTAELRAAGGWDESFATNQDFELNRRMGRDGIVWFADDLTVGYLPRTDLRALGAQYVRFGRWKARYWAETGDRPGLRQQAALAVGPLALVAALGATQLGWRGRVAACGVAVAGVLVVETVGSREPEAGPAAHLWALPAMALTSGGWLWGAWSGMLQRRRRR